MPERAIASTSMRQGLARVLVSLTQNEFQTTDKEYLFMSLRFHLVSARCGSGEAVRIPSKSTRKKQCTAKLTEHCFFPRKSVILQFRKDNIPIFIGADRCLLYVRCFNFIITTRRIS